MSSFLSIARMKCLNAEKAGGQCVVRKPMTKSPSEMDDDDDSDLNANKRRKYRKTRNNGDKNDNNDSDTDTDGNKDSNAGLDKGNVNESAEERAQKQRISSKIPGLAETLYTLASRVEAVHDENEQLRYSNGIWEGLLERKRRMRDNHGNEDCFTFRPRARRTLQQQAKK